MKKSSFINAQSLEFDYGGCIISDNKSSIKSNDRIKSLNDFKSRYPFFYDSVISKLAYNGNGPSCLDTKNTNLATEQLDQLNMIKGKFDEIIPKIGKCGPNGTLTNGYDINEVRTVYKDFFTHPQLCLFSLGALVENDPQFLLFILDSLFGISKPMLEYLRLSDKAVYDSFLQVAVLYIQTVSGNFPYQGNSSAPITVEQKGILYDGTLNVFLNKIIDIKEEPMILGFYSDILSRFQSLVEDCFVTTYKIDKKWNKTIEHSKTIIDLYKKVALIDAINITTTDLKSIFTNILNYKNAIFSKFDILVNIFRTNLNDKLTELFRNKGNINYINKTARSQFFWLNTARSIQKEMASKPIDYNNLFVRSLGSENLQLAYTLFCILISLYLSSVYQMIGDVVTDAYTRKYLYYNSDGSPIQTTIDGTSMDIELLLKNIVGSTMSHIYTIYYSSTVDYLNYINNYLLGIYSNGAENQSIASLLGLPADARLGVIRDNMYVALVHRSMYMGNAYMLVAQSCTLSTDPAELYDFPHNFETFVTSMQNKLAITQAASIPLFIVTLENQFDNHGNSAAGFRNISRFSSKSNFGEDEFSTSINNATYSGNLTSLADELSKNSPVLTTIRKLVADINNSTGTSESDYTIEIFDINTKIGILNAGNIDSLKIDLIMVPGGTTSTTFPTSTAFPTSTPSTNNMSMYLIALVILIGLIIIFYLMSKKKY
jgi:hypothetical protein